MQKILKTFFYSVAVDVHFVIVKCYMCMHDCTFVCVCVCVCLPLLLLLLLSSSSSSLSLSLTSPSLFSICYHWCHRIVIVGIVTTIVDVIAIVIVIVAVFVLLLPLLLFLLSFQGQDGGLASPPDITESVDISIQIRLQTPVLSKHLQKDMRSKYDHRLKVHN